MEVCDPLVAPLSSSMAFNITNLIKVINLISNVYRIEFNLNGKNIFSDNCA